MEIVTVGAIIFLVAFTALSLLLIKRHAKLFFLIALGITIIFIGLFVWVFLDVVDMQKHFANSTKIVFLEDNDKMLSGLIISEDPVFFNESLLDYYSDLYEQGDYETILGNHYKLLVFSVSTLEDLPESEYDLQFYTITKDDAIEALRSDHPSELFIEDPVVFTEGEEWLKAAIFSAMLIHGIMDMENPLFFFEQYKKGNIFVYPETPIFKVMRIMPLSFIRNVVEKTAQKLMARK